MKIDTYTKVLLTGIFIFLGMMVFEVKPIMKEEAGIMGGDEMISGGSDYLWHLKDGKLRYCGWQLTDSREMDTPKCSPWKTD